MVSVSVLREPRYYIVQIGDMFDEVVYDIGGARGTGAWSLLQHGT